MIVIERIQRKESVFPSLLIFGAVAVAALWSIRKFFPPKSAVTKSGGATATTAPHFSSVLLRNVDVSGYTLPAGTPITVLQVPSGTIGPETLVSVKVGEIPTQDLPVGASFPSPGSVFAIPAKAMM
jgi:hypothetical protein